MVLSPEPADINSNAGTTVSQAEPRTLEEHYPVEIARGRYPFDMVEWRIFRGQQLLLRPLHSADAQKLREFFDSHDSETIYRRYGFPKMNLSQAEAEERCDLEYERRFALAAFREEGDDEQMVAIARYEQDETGGFAETAIVIHERYRRRGVATYLLKRLHEQARRSGVVGFCGEIEATNMPMVELHRKLGHRVVFDAWAGVYRYQLKFSQT